MFSKYKKLFFSILLLVTAAVWGSGFLVMQNVMEAVSLHFALAVRFTIGALGLSYFVYKSKDGLNPRLIKHGLITGFLIYAAYAVQSSGLDYTTVGKNALLSSLYVVLVPFITWLVSRKKIKPAIYGSAAACTVGAALVSIPGNLEGSINLGDILSLAGSVLYAVHMVAVSMCSETSEIMPLSCVQFAFAALFAWIVSFAVDAIPSEMTNSTLAGLAWLSFMATLFAITIMNVGIKYVDSTKTAIILSTESLFACILGIILKDEPFTMRILMGMCLIMSAVIVSQLVSSSSEENSSVPIKIK